MRILKVLAAMLLTATIAVGCVAHKGSGVPDSIPAVGGAIDKATAHVETADNMVKAAKPESTATGKKFLTVAESEHAATLTALSDAKTQTVKAESERDQVEKKYDVLNDKYDAATHTIGYRIEVWVKRFIATVITLIVIHFGLLIAVPFFPAAAPLLLKLAAIINPLAWGQQIANSIHHG